MQPQRVILGVIISMAFCACLQDWSVRASEDANDHGFSWLDHVHRDMPDFEVATTLQNLKREDEIKTRSLRDVQLFENLADGVLLIQAGKSWGSGAALQCSEGSCLIVTNAHVVGRAKEVE